MSDPAGPAAGPGRPRPARDDPATYLDRDQLVAGTQRPVARAQLSSRAGAALWALRVFVLVVSAMVLYSFFAQLHS